MTTRRGNRRSRTTHTKKEWAGSLNIETALPPSPPQLYIVNEQYNLRNKRASQKKKQWMAKTVTSQTGHFAATPQSDIVRICAHDFQRHGDAFGKTENAFFVHL